MIRTRKNLGMSLVVSLRKKSSISAIISLAIMLLAVLIRRSLVRRLKSNQLDRNALYPKLVRLATNLALSYLELRVSQRILMIL